MAIFTTAFFVSLAVSVALSVGMRIISSLLNQGQRHQQEYGGQLQRAQADPGTSFTLRSAAEPQKIVFGTRRVAGTIVFAHCTDNNRLLNLIVAWAGHKIDSYGGLYFGDELVPLSAGVATGKYAGYAGCVDYLGTDDQPADGNLIIRAPGLWTENHRGRGIAYSYITLTWNRELYGQFDIAKIWRVVNGMKVYDHRDDTTTFSSNAALCVAAWMNSDKFGRGVPYEEMDLDELDASANICDEDVDLAEGGTEKRYECHAALTSDTPFIDNINKLLSSMHGECGQSSGLWSIRAGAWHEPELVFDENHFRAPFVVTNGLGREGFNAIKGKFANPAKNYQPDDFPAITSAAYEAEDGGDRVFQDVNLECTTSAATAQRIARIDLRSARQPISFTAQLKLHALRAEVGKNIAISFALLGWVEKPFRVKRMRLVPGFAPNGGDPKKPGIIGVDLDLIETAEFIYDWSQSDEIVIDPAPNTTLPGAFDTLPATNLRAVETLYATRAGGGVKAKVALTWDPSPDAFVEDGGWYIAEYKLSSASVWTKLSRVENTTTVDILDVDPGTYDFRVWAYRWTGARSQTAATITEQAIAGLGAAPAAPANLTLVPNGNFAVLRWDAPPDLDVEIGGTIIFKHASQLTGASWADGITISKPLPASLTFTVLPLVAGTYMAKYRDASGVWSEDFVSFPTAQSGALTFDALVGGSLVEDPTFAGTKTNCAVAGGVLKLGGAGLFSAIPLLSDIPSVGYYGGVSISGTYGWASKIDLGAKTKCRITVNTTSLLENVFDLISERTGDVSTWPQFGGDVSGNEADAHTEVRFTDDDPDVGTPTWSDWARLDVGEFDARGYEFRTLLTSNDPSFDIHISALSAVAEEVI